MAQIVCVHGIGQQHKGPEILRAEWATALRDGVALSGQYPSGVSDTDIDCVFYGDVFRPPGQLLGLGDPWLTAEDADEFEAALLQAWWETAAESDPGVISPVAETLARTPQKVQAALRALAGSAFFAGLAERAMLSNLRQVRLYMTDPGIREQVQERVAKAVGPDTRVLVGHSLGSVVAYEALCAHPEWPVTSLITLGSPLGVRNLIFDRLHPAPTKGAHGVRGAWPVAARAWTNVADRRDVVALVKDLRPLFGNAVSCCLVDNGASAHSVQPYLTASQTGAAIAAGLRAAIPR